ncbi:MAG: SDR family oxidoreductase [Acidimicrobiales bacterium]|nr:SDR family oxidoreductase [Acidimicrobiales bacterium]
MTSLPGARALVTGANGGLGRAISAALRQEGCSLVVTGRRAEQVEAVARDVSGRAVVADLAVRSDLYRLLEEAGEVDIVVVNAALPASGDVAEWDQADIDKAFEVNLGSAIAMTRALLPQFRARGSGHFVFVSSLSGKVASRGGALYSATKYGLRGFAAGLRCDLYGSGIGCSLVNPGFVRDAGMFVDAGGKTPLNLGTVTSKRCAAAVVKVIRQNRAELDVAPLYLRLATTLGALTPGLSAPVQARLDPGLSDTLVRGQRTKR